MDEDYGQSSMWHCKMPPQFTAPLKISRSHEDNLALLHPTATQFVTNFIMVDRLITLRIQAVELTVLDMHWDTWSTKVSRKPFERSHRVKACNLKESFWKQCQNIVTVCESVLCCLCRFDGKNPIMGENIFCHVQLGKTIDVLCCAPFNMPSANHVELVRSFYRRWTVIRIDLHYVGATLTLRYARSPKVDNNKVWQGFLSAIMWHLNATPSIF